MLGKREFMIALARERHFGRAARAMRHTPYARMSSRSKRGLTGQTRIAAMGRVQDSGQRRRDLFLIGSDRFPEMHRTGFADRAVLLCLIAGD